MLACYDGAATAYGPHIDNVDGGGLVDGRVLGMVLYLSPVWDQANEAEFVVFSPERVDLADLDVQRHWHNIWSEPGNLIFFSADRMLREVRPTHSKRLALS